VTDLGAVLRGRVRRAEPLALHTTLRIGGPAAWYAEPEEEREVAAALAWAEARGLPWRVIGLGSNLLCPDEGFAGVVLDLRAACAGVRWDGTLLEVGAGVHLAPLVQEAARRGLSGLEGLAGVPGTVGGALAMNAGTAAGEMAAVVRQVRVLAPDGRVRTLTAEEMRFGYRSSRLQAEPLVALAAVLQLRPADPEAVRRDLAQKALRRRQTQPLELPNAGSVWRNPPGDFAGRLVEAAGCKGLRRGDAQVSPKHANFIVNLGGARAEEVIALMAEVRRRVRQRFGVCLEPELRWLLGQDDLERRLSEAAGG
jgi:UDP-N-acetylmuramate dehydrogenase